MYACIAVPERDDEYLTHDSFNFHKKLGFKTVGTFKKCGCKFGRWYGMVWMQKQLARHVTEPARPQSYRA